MSNEAEIPGIRVSKEQLRIICARYYFASKFVFSKTVLEVGCGPGIGLGYLAEKAKKVVGVDISKENLDYASRHYQGEHYKGKIEIHQINAHNLSSFKEQAFDVVASMATVYALQLAKFLEECHRILKENGKLVFCLPNKDVPGFRPAKLSFKYYSVPELFKLLNRYKFEPKIFAAFPITKKVYLQKGISRILNSVIGGRLVRRFINRFVLHKVILRPEITKEDMGLIKDIKFVSLNPNLVNYQYQVLYLVAQKKL